MKLHLIFAIALFIALSSGAFLTHYSSHLLQANVAYAARPTGEQVHRERPWLLEDEKNTINVFTQAAKNVVFVSSSTKIRDFFSHNVFEVPAGTGSGFFWDNKGHIVTNYHVIETAAKRSAKVTINLKDGKSFPAKIVGVYPRKDIAVLKIDGAKNLPNGFSKTLADSSKLVVGQKTIAIGNPFELSHTLTTGVVSALGRSVPSPAGYNIHNRDMIQTDAAINPGNSGGPLMDSRGYLIGMNTAIFSQSGSSAGVGFAVPANTIKRITNQLIEHGKIIQPGLGIIPLPDEYANSLDITGVVIVKVLPRGSADRAGLIGSSMSRSGSVKLGDIIVKIDNEKVENLDDLLNILDTKKVGEVVDVTYLRKNKRQKTKVKLQKVDN